MKRLALCFATIFVLAICSIPASSQLDRHVMLKVDIPFDFTVQEMSFPKGLYLIEKVGDRAQRLRSAQTMDSVIYMSIPMHNPNRNTQKRFLSFNRYGNEYVLKQIWDGEDGYKLGTSRREVILAQQQKSSTQQVEAGK